MSARNPGAVYGAALDKLNRAEARMRRAELVRDLRAARTELLAAFRGTTAAELALDEFDHAGRAP
ncbi:MAG: hypothetical protein ACREQZ_03640 [Woeseiaceae bacterium]